MKNCKVVYRGSTSLLAGREYHHLTGFTATVNDRIKIHNPLSIVKEYRFPLAFSSTNFSKIGIFFPFSNYIDFSLLIFGIGNVLQNHVWIVKMQYVCDFNIFQTDGM